MISIGNYKKLLSQIILLLQLSGVAVLAQKAMKELKAKNVRTGENYSVLRQWTSDFSKTRSST